MQCDFNEYKMSVISDIVERYNALKQGTHTGASAFSRAKNAESAVDRIAYGMISLAINNTLVRQNKIPQDAAATIGKAIVSNLARDFEDENVANQVLEYARTKL